MFVFFFFFIYGVNIIYELGAQMNSEILPWLVDKKVFLMPKKGCSEDTKCSSMPAMPSGISTL